MRAHVCYNPALTGVTLVQAWHGCCACLKLSHHRSLRNNTPPFASQEFAAQLDAAEGDTAGPLKRGAEERARAAYLSVITLVGNLWYHINI